MKREFVALIGVSLIVIVALSAFYAYSASPAPAKAAPMKVLATFYPVYDFAKNVGGTRIDLSLLVPETGCTRIRANAVIDTGSGNRKRPRL